MFGYGGRLVLTGAIVITLIGSPLGAAASPSVDSVEAPVVDAPSSPPVVVVSPSSAAAEVVVSSEPDSASSSLSPHAAANRARTATRVMIFHRARTATRRVARA